MIKPTQGKSNSFRKPARQVSALPQATAQSVHVWRPKLNDRVQTPSGTGTVVKIADDMYLIDLENQLAQIWERLVSIKPPK